MSGGEPRAARESAGERPLVTVAVPTYRRLENLPGVLRSLEAQDYPNLDVLVSDNGLLGDELDEVLERHLDRPYRVRRTGETLPISAHFDALTREAEGEYFLLLCDDDELGPGCISALVDAMEEDPDVRVALPRVQVLDREGRNRSVDGRGPPPPRRMDDLEFLHAWCRTEYDFVCFVTNLARTDEIRRVGGYPEFAKGNWIDNALLVKLLLGGKVAFVPEAEFRYRVYEESTGLDVSYEQLALAAREFLAFLESDPVLREFAEEHPDRWSEAREMLERMTWGTYRYRWKNLYYDRLSRAEWFRAAFAMPWIPAYYREVVPYLLRRGLAVTTRGIRSAIRSIPAP